jgi:outer membrane protein assembly factor BamA
LEYRHPLYSVVQPGTYKEVETFRLTLFSDWGLLDPKAYEMDFSETRATWGFGVGMVTPFPVSLNFGFPILEGEGDRKQVFSFSLLNLSF